MDKKETIPTRKQYLINKKLQLKFAVMIAIVLVVMLVLIEFHTYLTIKSILPNILSATVGKLLKTIHFWLVVNGLLYLAAVCVISVFVSHKIAGPIYKFQKEIKNIIQGGDLTGHFRLRKGDELTDMAVALNNFVADLRNRIAKYDELRAETVQEIKEILNSIDTKNLNAEDCQKIEFIYKEIDKLILPEKPLKV
ncbi:MAG: hypothetical protein AB1349_03330 [Elusimicrobiota bacterium]